MARYVLAHYRSVALVLFFVLMVSCGRNYNEGWSAISIQSFSDGIAESHLRNLFCKHGIETRLSEGSRMSCVMLVPDDQVYRARRILAQDQLVHPNDIYAYLGGDADLGYYVYSKWHLEEIGDTLSEYEPKAKSLNSLFLKAAHEKLMRYNEDYPILKKIIYRERKFYINPYTLGLGYDVSIFLSASNGEKAKRGTRHVCVQVDENGDLYGPMEFVPFENSDDREPWCLSSWQCRFEPWENNK